MSKDKVWRVRNLDEQTIITIKEYAKLNGYTIARALKELVTSALIEEGNR